MKLGARAELVLAMVHEGCVFDGARLVTPFYAGGLTPRCFHQLYGLPAGGFMGDSVYGGHDMRVLDGLVRKGLAVAVGDLANPHRLTPAGLDVYRAAWARRHPETDAATT